MLFGSPYPLAAEQYLPLRQQAFADNVEEETNGEITVNLATGGSLGGGLDVAQKTQQGAIDAAMSSLGNFSPFVPALDLVNLPYLAAENQPFANLVMSDVWTEVVERGAARENNFEIAYYVIPEPRALGLKAEDPLPTPQAVDEANLKHRVNASQLLAQLWDMAGANPVPIAFGETATAMEEGVVSSLDVCYEFQSAYGFNEIVDYQVLVRAVQDAQVVMMNRDWYASLPQRLQDGIDRASERTWRGMLDRIPTVRQNAYDLMRDSGVEFVELSDSQLQRWRDAVSYERPEWDRWKRRLAGDMETFERIEAAVDNDSGYSVPPTQLPG